MYVAVINKLNFQVVKKREKLQFSDLKELLSWVCLAKVRRFRCWNGYNV